MENFPEKIWTLAEAALGVAVLAAAVAADVVDIGRS